MNGAPLVSCIVPAYNAARYVSQALRSILRQTYRATEVIVVDDGSTDATPRVLEGYAPRVKVLHQANAGVAAARNAGASIAGGEFVAFLDADDLWHPRKLVRQMECFRHGAGPDLCFTHVRNFWSPEVPPARRAGGQALLAPWPGRNCSALVARRSAFERVGPLNPELEVGEDGDWFLRAAELGLRRQMLPEVLVYRRLHEDNLSRRKRQESRDAVLERIKAHLDRRRGR